jgi:hypothetical protein
MNPKKRGQPRGVRPRVPRSRPREHPPGPTKMDPNKIEDLTDYWTPKLSSSGLVSCLVLPPGQLPRQPIESINYGRSVPNYNWKHLRDPLRGRRASLGDLNPRGRACIGVGARMAEGKSGKAERGNCHQRDKASRLGPVHYRRGYLKTGVCATRLCGARSLPALD